MTDLRTISYQDMVNDHPEAGEEPTFALYGMGHQVTHDELRVFNHVESLMLDGYSVYDATKRVGTDLEKYLVLRSLLIATEREALGNYDIGISPFASSITHCAMFSQQSIL